MGGGAAGGPWRHQQWSRSWILPPIRNQVNIAINVFCLFVFFVFFCLTCKIIHN